MRIFILLMGSILLATTSGCQGTPTQRYEQGVKAYSTAGELAVIAIDRDFVSLETAEVIGKINHAAHAELVAMRASLIANDNDMALSHYARFRRILASLIEITSDPGVPVPEELAIPSPSPLFRVPQHSGPVKET